MTDDSSIEFTVDEGELVCVVDTNVLVDLLSCHDLVKAAEEGNAAKQDYRVIRAGEALRLAIYLNKISAVTVSHIHEAAEIAEREAPPSGDTIRTAFTQCVIHFVDDVLLPRWRPGGLPRDVSTSLRGNKADEMLISLAKKYGRPLVSNEGRSQAGRDLQNRLLKMAREHCVEVVTPGEFYRGRLPEFEISRFMHWYRILGPQHRKGEPDYLDAQRVLKDMHDLYRFILEQTAPKRIKKKKRNRKEPHRG